MQWNYLQLRKQHTHISYKSQSVKKKDLFFINPQFFPLPLPKRTKLLKTCRNLPVSHRGSIAYRGVLTYSTSRLERARFIRSVDDPPTPWRDSRVPRALSLGRGVLSIGEIRLINGGRGCNTNEVWYRLLKCWRVSGIERYRNPIESHSCTLHAGIACLPTFRFLPDPSILFHPARDRERWTSGIQSSVSFLSLHFPRGSSNYDLAVFLLNPLASFSQYLSNDVDRNDRPSESEAAAS